MQPKKISIALYRPEAISVFSSSRSQPLGGAETRTATLAKALAQLPGVEVTVIVAPVPAHTITPPPGINLVFDPLTGPSLISVAYQRLRLELRERSNGLAKVALAANLSFWRDSLLVGGHWLATKLGKWKKKRSRPVLHPTTRTINADVIICLGMAVHRADVIYTCKQRGLLSVVGIACDIELSEAVLQDQDTLVGFEPSSRIRFAITEADIVLVQSKDQLDILDHRFKRQGILMRNPTPEFNRDTLSSAQKLECAAIPKDPYVLWIGRADRLYKQPLFALQVATRCPDVLFFMVVNREDETVVDEIVKKSLPNLHLIERLSPEVADLAISQSLLMLNTSAHEGFPNAFLQAAKYGVPIVSLNVDPDGYLSKHGIGICANGDMDVLVAEVNRLCSDKAARDKLGAAGQRIVREHHNGIVIANQLLTAIRERFSAEEVNKNKS